MRNFLKNNLLSLTVCVLTIASWTVAGTITRIYTFAGGDRAIATHVNAEFNNVLDFINNAGIGSNNIAGGGIATANIASYAVTKAKLDTATLTISANSGAFSGTNPHTLAVTNLSTTITTTGRPVRMSLVSGGTFTVSSASTNVSYVMATNSTTSNILFLKDNVTTVIFPLVGASAAGLPCSAFQFVESPSAGSHTYSVAVKASGGGTIFVYGCSILVEEL